MRLFLLIALFLGLVVAPVVSAEEAEKYSMVEFRVDHNSLDLLMQTGLALDCCGMEMTENEMIFQVPVSASEMAMLKNQRLTYKVLVDDMAKDYEARIQADMANLRSVEDNEVSMKLGSVGGGYTLDEFVRVLDELYETHKSKGIISRKRSIGKTVQGRDIWMVKISDNADSEEGEPGAMYTGMHHAREIASQTTVIYFMYYVLENYDKNQRVKNIVDNRQLYFVPIVNPDGYAYNCSTNPKGGGMWRKNRNGSGVDLNRNYGPHELWNYPNNGNSKNPSSDTYRGTAPFSEKETQAIRAFMQSHKVHTMLNYHTYSNLLIYPYGYKNQIAHPLYREMAVKMTANNGYRYGTAPELLYPVAGVSDDWGDVKDGAKGRVFAMTPEVGRSGFWPGPSQIFPLAKENIEANLILAEYAQVVASFND